MGTPAVPAGPRTRPERPAAAPPEKFETCQLRPAIAPRLRRSALRGRRALHLGSLGFASLASVASLVAAPSPEAALAVMLELNDRHALDGRDANSNATVRYM